MPRKLKPVSQSAKRKNAQPSERDLKIFDRWQRGERPSLLAKEHKLCRQRIAEIVRTVSQWRASGNLALSEQVRESQRKVYEKLVPQVLEMWERSCGENVRTKTVSGDADRIETTREQKHGDPTLLMALEKLLQGHRVIAGLNEKPTPLAQNKPSVVINNVDLRTLSEDRLASLRQLALNAEALVSREESDATGHTDDRLRQNQ